MSGNEPTPVWIMLDCPVCGEQVRHHCDAAAYDEWYQRMGGISFSELYGERAAALWRKYIEQPNIMDEYDPNARREVREP